jgi:hypothetical protein
MRIGISIIIFFNDIFHFRNEANMCSICWSAATANDFDVSGVSNVITAINTGYNVVSVYITSYTCSNCLNHYLFNIIIYLQGCCGYTAPAIQGYDCVIIPGAKAAEHRKERSTMFYFCDSHRLARCH